MVTILSINNLYTIITILISLHLCISLLPVIIQITVTARHKQVINNIIQLIRTLILINCKTYSLF